MKKAINMLFTTVVSFMGLLVLVMTTSCGPITEGAELEDESKFEALAYRQYLSDSEIVEGSATALATISEYVGKDVLEKDEWPSFQMESNPVEGSISNAEDLYLKYDLKLYDESEDIKVFFLYKDDTALVEVSDPYESCVVESDGRKVVDQRFPFYDGRYGWREGSEYHAVFGPGGDTFYRVTSIWLYDPKKNECRLAWNNFDCPIWANYADQVNNNQ